MAKISDDDILEMTERLRQELNLTENDRDAVILAVQRLVWPPSPHLWMHDGEHVSVTITRQENGGWRGELRCPHGCARRWRVNHASREDVIFQALSAAHIEYQTGKITASEPAPRQPGKRLTLDEMLSRSEYVEVEDHRLTPTREVAD